MLRFEEELNGVHGEFWKKHAEEEIAKMRRDYESGELIIDDRGVARWKCGNIVPFDCSVVISYMTDKIDLDATAKARTEQTARVIERYRRNYRGPSEEELYEMRAAFGAGETVVNVITGERIRL